MIRRMRWVPGGVIVALTLALPASAQDDRPRRVQPKPKSGGPMTTFVVRYHAIGQDAMGGDQLYVLGPKGTRCDGVVIYYAPVGHEEGTQVISLGPRVDESDDGRRNRYHYAPRDPDSERRLGSWCRGVYRGWVEFETEGDRTPEKHTRFRFAVR
jgi:hypothetical protein